METVGTSGMKEDSGNWSAVSPGDPSHKPHLKATYYFLGAKKLNRLSILCDTRAAFSCGRQLYTLAVHWQLFGFDM